MAEMDTAQRRRWLIPVVALVAAAVLIIAAFEVGHHLGGGGSGNGPLTVTGEQGPAETSSRYPGALVFPPGKAVPKPDLTLTDTAGQPYDLTAATARRTTLVYFGYTHCPDVCPINMALAAAALHRMSPSARAQVTVVFVTTDPTRDTGPVIRAWLDHFDTGLAPFVGLRGSITQIHQAEAEVGMPLSTVATEPGQAGYEIQHAGYTLIYATDGQAHLSVDDTETAKDYATTLDHLVRSGYQAS